MNYLAHARHLLDRPWALVGAALPDWLRIADRRFRLRPGGLRAPGAGADPEDREIARGVVEHHEDDRWFHRAEAFRETQARIARSIREAFPDRPERRVRASFLAHVLAEMLLDAELAARDPSVLPAYYRSLDALDPGEVARRAARLAPAPAGNLARLVHGFRSSRFLATYEDDASVVFRLNQVGLRVRQPPLPDGFRRIVESARAAVEARAGELLGYRETRSGAVSASGPGPASPTPAPPRDGRGRGGPCR